jgi:PPM family protein phosphatase
MRPGGSRGDRRVPDALRRVQQHGFPMSRLSNYLKQIMRRHEAHEPLPAADQSLLGAATLEPPSDPTIVRRTTLAPSDDLCGITDVGRMRTHNEDQIRLSSDRRTLIVADGMGGHMSGDVASAMAADAVEAHLAGARPGLAESDITTVEETLLCAVEAAQTRVLAAGQDQERGRQMGSTLIVAIIHGDVLLTCHVGDVRCYVLSGTQLRAVTRDHSVVAELVAAGKLPAEQAHLHATKNQVLQAIGMLAGFDPDINQQTLALGDRVLLCSDGLWEMLPDPEIVSIVRGQGSMQQLATQLVDRANEAGGNDNISVILYEHRSQAM